MRRLPAKERMAVAAKRAAHSKVHAMVAALRRCGACLLVLGQVTDEGNGFVVPAPTDLKSKDDDAGATCAQQFWVRPFFGKAG